MWPLCLLPRAAQHRAPSSSSCLGMHMAQENPKIFGGFSPCQHEQHSMMETTGPVQGLRLCRMCHLSCSAVASPSSIPSSQPGFHLPPRSEPGQSQEQGQVQNWLPVFDGSVQPGSPRACSPPGASALSPALPAQSCQRLGSVCQHLEAMECAGCEQQNSPGHTARTAEQGNSAAGIPLLENAVVLCLCRN